MQKAIRKFKIFCGWTIIMVNLYVAITILLLVFIPRSKECLPERIRVGIHTDYTIAVTQRIPRNVTSFCLCDVAAPQALISSNGTVFVCPFKPGSTNVRTYSEGSPMPIPVPGEWHVAVMKIREDIPWYVPYVTFTTNQGWHFRLGIRWDDVDNYYVFPSAAWHRL